MKSRSSFSGPRRSRFPQDIPQITELVELCFANVLDYSSRKNLRDVRWIAQRGDVAWTVSLLVGVLNPEEWNLSSVWEEGGRIVANATLTRRTPEAGAWLISNVAVHPDFRRRGIARGLVQHALGEIRSRGGRTIYLQVDAVNESAVKIYRDLGFVEIGRRIAWLRAREEKKIPPPVEIAASPCRTAARKSSEWAEEYALWRDVSPYGSTWNTPLREESFRPSLWKGIEQLLGGETEKHFLARCGSRAEAALSAFSHWSGWEGVLIQREGTAGTVEWGLLSAAWKAFPPAQGVLLETTPEVSVDTLVKLGFQKRRTFIWMRYTIAGGAP